MSARGEGEPWRLLDDIDRLVDETMRDGEPRSGYDFGDPAFPDCPNPYCDETWHGLAITTHMYRMRLRGNVDPDYDHRTDDSPVLCPGSGHLGEWEDPGVLWAELRNPREEGAQDCDGHEVEPEAGADAEADDPRKLQADAMWMAVTRPATVVWTTTLLVALTSMFLTPVHWRWLTPAIGIAALVAIAWLLGSKRRRFPPGYLRERLCARPETLFALVLMPVAGWLPALWCWRTPMHASRDVADAYRVLLIACALAGVAHAIVQLSRIRRVPREMVDGAGETDLSKHSTNMLALAILWLLLALPLVLLLGLTFGRLTYQPDAVWAATGVLAVTMVCFLLETAVLARINRDSSETVISILLFFAVKALLLWSLHVLGTTHFALR
ncbi:hypothetical protein ACIP5Y_29935 [Nocardia sp. NPDC088792]|uniref:hypothetical protein n=1 Tax=Nocardia sp. NPDC088792 TaxID=3364332 RepID=UPI0037FBDC57